MKHNSRLSHTMMSGAVGLTMLVGSLAAQADNIPNDRTITAIRTYTNWAAVQYDPPYTNDVGCAGANADKFAVIEWSSDAEKKTMYAALLSAYLSGKTFGAGIRGCWSNYGGGVPLIYRVDIYD